MSLGENSKVITFDVLQQQLQIDQGDVESFVIDGNQLLFFLSQIFYDLI